MNALEELRSAGQSIWLDFLRREMITSGYLDRLRREDAVTGITSNPTIFNRAISHGSDYDDAIHDLAAAGQVKPSDIYYDLALEDVRTSSDVLRPVYERTAGRDGFVARTARSRERSRCHRGTRAVGADPEKGDA